jgi:hypothetical protein
MSARQTPTGVATIGGRGQEAPVPEMQVMHTATITMVTTMRHEDWFITAEEAIDERVKRLSDAKTPFTRDGMTLRFTQNGYETTITYAEAGS